MFIKVICDEEMGCAMKVFIRYLFFVILYSVTISAMATELEGLWLSHDDNGKPTGYITIIEENGVYKGVIEKGLESDKEEKFCTACQDERKGKRLIGMTMLKGVVDKGHGSFQGTEILDPFSGNTYRVKLKLKDAGQVLEVRGYLGVSLFGRTQVWRRVENGQ
jgi:uncharacterized protein (DUF2147 family)